MKAYIPISVKEEKPEGEEIFLNTRGDFMVGWYDEKDNICESEHEILPYVTHWLKEVTIPDEEEIEEAAKNNADAIDKRGCSYWNGLFEGYQMGQRDLLSKLK